MSENRYTVFTENGAWQASYSKGLGEKKALTYAKITARHVKGVVRNGNEGEIVSDYRKRKKRK